MQLPDSQGAQVIEDRPAGAGIATNAGDLVRVKPGFDGRFGEARIEVEVLIEKHVAHERHREIRERIKNSPERRFVEHVSWFFQAFLAEVAKPQAFSGCNSWNAVVTTYKAPLRFREKRLNGALALVVRQRGGPQ